jgi:hypothetical protein
MSKTIIILGIIVLILFILMIVGLGKKWKHDTLFALFTGNICFLFLFASILFSEIGNKEGQINALKGKYSYKMEIKYTLQDSIYVPTDTLFIEINK